MAIQNSKTLLSGVTGNYWRLINISIDFDALRVNFFIGLYLDSTHGTNGSKEIFHKNINLPITLDQIAGTLTGAYQKILDAANIDVPNLNTSGTHKFDIDLAGGSIVA